MLICISTLQLPWILMKLLEINHSQLFFSPEEAMHVFHHREALFTTLSEDCVYRADTKDMNESMSILPGQSVQYILNLNVNRRADSRTNTSLSRLMTGDSTTDLTEGLTVGDLKKNKCFCCSISERKSKRNVWDCLTVLFFLGFT